MDERFKSHAWKACVGLNPPRVRIPPAPPEKSLCGFPAHVKHLKALASLRSWGFFVGAFGGAYLLVCSIFIAVAIKVETSLMLPGMMSVVLASLATLL